jgi:hypothetical protein
MMMNMKTISSSYGYDDYDMMTSSFCNEDYVIKGVLEARVLRKKYDDEYDYYVKHLWM